MVERGLIEGGCQKARSQGDLSIVNDLDKLGTTECGFQLYPSISTGRGYSEEVYV